jgi:hypothetical protein
MKKSRKKYADDSNQVYFKNEDDDDDDDAKPIPNFNDFNDFKKILIKEIADSENYINGKSRQIDQVKNERLFLTNEAVSEIQTIKARQKELNKLMADIQSLTIKFNSILKMNEEIASSVNELQDREAELKVAKLINQLNFESLPNELKNMFEKKTDGKTDGKTKSKKKSKRKSRKKKSVKYRL